MCIKKKSHFNAAIFDCPRSAYHPKMLYLNFVLYFVSCVCLWESYLPCSFNLSTVLHTIYLVPVITCPADSHFVFLRMLRVKWWNWR